MPVDIGVFACKCGCGLNVIKEKVVDLVDAIQSVAPECHVNSGCRCEKHNEEEGGVVNSPHLIGDAVDISCPNSSIRYMVLRKLFALGVKRVGIGKNFIHFDVSEEKSQWVMWLY